MGLSLSVLTGCAATSQLGEGTISSFRTLTVQFVGQGNYNVQPQQGTVSLYAVEKSIADVPATLIQQKKVQVSQVPFSVEFKIPVNHHKQIKPTIRDTAEISYYVTWEPDTKNLTAKDVIVIDYDRKFPSVMLNGTTQKIYLREVK